MDKKVIDFLDYIELDKSGTKTLFVPESRKEEGTSVFVPGGKYKIKAEISPPGSEFTLMAILDETGWKKLFKYSYGVRISIFFIKLPMGTFTFKIS